MMTASHLPPDRNGLKFFTAEGGVGNQNVVDILAFAEQGHFAKAEAPRPVVQVDFLSVYAQQLVELIRKGAQAGDYAHPLSPFRILVDAGNGLGGFFC